jgi:3-oxoacyl-[acyl-carrier-protein] synthase III
VTALEAVATYVPQTRVPVEDLADAVGLNPVQVKVFRRYHGLAEVRCDPDGTLLDLLLAAATRLDALRGREADVRYVLYARAIPVGVPFPLNPLHELCDALGLRHAVAFTVTQQACATGLQAIDIAGRLLAADPYPGALALVIAGEKTFTLESRLLPETSLFGEGSAVGLVRLDGPRDRMLAYAVDVRGEFDGEFDDVAVRFQREYPESLADVLLAAVARAGLELDDIEVVLPHNVNLVSWRRLCRRIGFPVERVVLDNVSRLGHVFCADAFINYQTARERGLLSPGTRFLMAAAGAGRGATFSAMVFEH